MDFTIFLWKMQRKILKIHDNHLLNTVTPVLEEALNKNMQIKKRKSC